MDIDQDGRKELILTPGTNWDDFQIYQVYTIGEDEKAYWRMILLHAMESVILQNIKLLHITAADHRKCLRVWNIMQWTELRMTESFAVNMEVDLNTYLPVYNVHNTSKGTDTTIMEDEYEAIIRRNVHH